MGRTGGFVGGGLLGDPVGEEEAHGVADGGSRCWKKKMQ